MSSIKTGTRDLHELSRTEQRKALYGISRSSVGSCGNRVNLVVEAGSTTRIVGDFRATSAGGVDVGVER